MSVLADQSSSTTGADGLPGDANVKASDLLYMHAATIHPDDVQPGEPVEGGKVKVTMKHAFAKLTVIVNMNLPATGTENPITALTVGGTKLKAQFTPAAAEPLDVVAVSTGNGPAAITARNSAYTGPEKANSLLPQSMTAQYECIILPQTVEAGNLTVTAATDSKTYTYTHMEEIPFTGNKQYKLTLNITGESTIEIADNVGVGPWDDEEEDLTPGEGENEMADTNTLTDKTQPSETLSGSGTAESPYLIQNAADLKCFINQSRETEWQDTHFRLDTDLNIATDAWIPIGKRYSIADDIYDYWIFSGTFDGNGHTISGKLVHAGGYYRLKFGFFSELQNATVKNLNMAASISVTGQTEGDESITIGGIAGNCTYNSTNSITGCTNSGNIEVEYGDAYVGGIAGQITDGATVSGCTNSGDITGGQYTGGIVGRAIKTISGSFTITGCRNSGTITESKISQAGSAGTGGIAGYLREGTITKCINTGEIKPHTEQANPNHNKGGIVGEIPGSGGSVHQCVNQGNIYKGSNESQYRGTGLLAGCGETFVYNCCKNEGGKLYEADGTESENQYLIGKGTSGGGTDNLAPCTDSSHAAL